MKETLNKCFHVTGNRQQSCICDSQEHYYDKYSSTRGTVQSYSCSFHFFPQSMGTIDEFNTRKKQDGCYISTVTGIILFLLVVCIAVSVGLIVHFAHPDRNKVCTEPIPDDIMNGNCPEPHVSQIPDQDIWIACVNISIENDECKYTYLLQ